MKYLFLFIFTIVTINVSLAQAFKKRGILIGLEPIERTGIKTGLFHTVDHAWTFRRVSLNYSYLPESGENMVSTDYSYSFLLVTAGLNLNYTFNSGFSNFGILPKFGLTLPQGWIKTFPFTVVATYGYNVLLINNYDSDVTKNVFSLELLLSLEKLFHKKI